MTASKGGAKTVVIIVVAAVVVGGTLVGLVAHTMIGVLSRAQASGEEMQRTFFTAVLSGDANQVTALFHPKLREEVDGPVLAQWMVAVKDNLGEFKGLSKMNFSASTEIRGGVKTEQTAGTVNFEKGSARSELKYLDGQLTAFDVVSDSIPKAWFHDLAPGQTATALYQERGKAFLTLFLSDKPDDAFAMMYESLQKAAPLEKLKAMSATISKELGPLKGIECQSERADGPGKLKILYRVQGEKAATLASVKFQHQGDEWKYYLVAFKFNEDAAPAETPAESVERPAERPATQPAEKPAERP
jgi:hypothetical protein